VKNTNKGSTLSSLAVKKHPAVKAVVISLLVKNTNKGRNTITCGKPL
jgi:hypothetical protein